MKRETLIEEYTRLYEKHREMKDEILRLEQQIIALKEEERLDRRWMDSINAEFDRQYGCDNFQHRGTVTCHLYYYIQMGEEVPE